MLSTLPLPFTLNLELTSNMGNKSQSNTRPFVVMLSCTLLAIALASVLVLATDFVLLIFLAMLFGVFLTHTSHLLSQHLPIKAPWSLTFVLTTLLALVIGGTLLFGVRIENRLQSMSGNIESSAKQLETWLSKHPLAESAFRKIPFAGEILNYQSEPKSESERKHKKSEGGNQNSKLTQELANDESGPSQPDQKESSSESSANKKGVSAEVVKSVAGRVFRVFGKMMGTTFGLIANLGVIFFMGLFFAINPTLYRDGFVKLFSKDRRERVAYVMDQMAESMFAWLNGRFITMVITGLGTGLGMWLIGVPMAATLGAVTALLTFVPNIGGLIALSLAVTMALPQGPMTVMWAVIVYGVFQLIESNIISPIIQQQKTSIPPALLLGFQIVLGALTGFLGLLVATPLLAATLVGAKEFWVRDTLGDDSV